MRPDLLSARRHAGLRPVWPPRLGNQVFPEPKPDLLPARAGLASSVRSRKGRQGASQYVVRDMPLQRGGAARRVAAPLFDRAVESDLFSGQAGRGLDCAPGRSRSPKRVQLSAFAMGAGKALVATQTRRKASGQTPGRLERFCGPHAQHRYFPVR